MIYLLVQVFQQLINPIGKSALLGSQTSKLDYYAWSVFFSILLAMNGKIWSIILFLLLQKKIEVFITTILVIHS